MSSFQKNSRIALMQSGNQCAFTDCTNTLSKKEGSEQISLGEVAHIKGDKLGSARYDSAMSQDQRNSADNLIVLCGYHHKMIDDAPENFTEGILQEMKKVHKVKVENSLINSLPQVSFAELDVITRHIVSSSEGSSDGFDITSVEKKIEKNNLSNGVRALILAGFSRITLVRSFIEKDLYPNYGERLKQGFLDKYTELVAEDFSGDDIFNQLLFFACRDTTKSNELAAGLVVIAYFFESCDIFEK